MRLIDAEALSSELIERQYAEQTMGILVSAYPQMRAIVSKQPTVDAVEVVRCKDCGHCVDHHEKAYCNHDLGLIGIVKPDFYCPYGERRTDGSTK